MTDDGSSGQTSDSIRERASASTVKIWIYLGADRRGVALGIVATLFFGIIVGGLLHPTPARELLLEGDVMETLGQGLFTSVVTIVTLVLTISQLVLSQEQGAVGDQRNRMQEATAFRSDVADLLTEPVSPTDPSAFLGALVGATQERAEEVREAVADLEDDELRTQILEFVDGIVENSESVRADLDGAEFGKFEVVRAALDFNYSWKLYAANRLRLENESVLSEHALDRLEALSTVLKLFGPAREHFKTLYFQWELIDLSQNILWVSIPSIIVSTWALLFFEAPLGSIFGVPYALLLVATVVAISLLPFAVLLSYILRIVTVTKRTLSIGPFILRDAEPEIKFEE